MTTIGKNVEAVLSYEECSSKNTPVLILFDVNLEKPEVKSRRRPIVMHPFDPYRNGYFDSITTDTIPYFFEAYIDQEVSIVANVEGVAIAAYALYTRYLSVLKQGESSDSIKKSGR